MSDERKVVPVGVPAPGEGRSRFESFHTAPAPTLRLEEQADAAPRNYSECRTDQQMIQFAQSRLWEILEEHHDPDARANGYLALGTLLGFAIRGTR